MNNHKKVLFLVNHDVVIYNFRLELVEKLISEGYEVHISSPDGTKIEELVKLGCHFHEISFNRHGTNITDEFKLLKTYHELMRQVNPIAVLTYTIKPNIYGGLAARKLKIPYFTNITGLGTTFAEGSNAILKGVLKHLYIVSLRDAKYVYFQNEENLQIFLKQKILNAPTKLLPGSGVNLDRYYYRTYPSDEDINIMYFGRLMGSKGINELLEAAKQIQPQYKHVKFHLVGFSEDPNLLKRVEESQKDGYIIYHGYQKDVMPFMEKASVVIQPSYHEGMSNVLLEASAIGRPVLASNIYGCKEIVEANQTGLLFEPKNVNSLVQVIEEFISLSLKERLEMGKKAREKVQREFSRQIIVDEYMNELNKIKI